MHAYTENNYPRATEQSSSNRVASWPLPYTHKHAHRQANTNTHTGTHAHTHAHTETHKYTHAHTLRHAHAQRWERWAPHSHCLPEANMEMI